ncbi:MAG: YIP1 family protein [Bacteroidales bacterium]
MKKSKNLQIIGDILFHPGRFFNSFAGDMPSSQTFFLSYGLPLMVLGAAGRMAKILQLREQEDVLLSGDQLAGIFLISFTGYALSVYLGAIIIAKLARPFKSEENRDKAMLLIMLSYTPFMLAQALSALSPVLTPLTLLGLIYMVFLFWKGSGPILSTPPVKMTGFTLVGFFVIFGISYLTILVLSGLFIFAGS